MTGPDGSRQFHARTLIGRHFSVDAASYASLRAWVLSIARAPDLCRCQRTSLAVHVAVISCHRSLFFTGWPALVFQSRCLQACIHRVAPRWT